MILVFKLGLLVSLVRLSVLYDPLGERPLFLASFYTAGAWLFNAAVGFEYPFWPAWLLAGWLLAWLYFWLLSIVENPDAIWILVVMSGVPLVLI